MDIVYLRLVLRRLQCLIDLTLRTWMPLAKPLGNKNKNQKCRCMFYLPKYKRTRIDCNIGIEREQSIFRDTNDNVVPTKIVPRPLNWPIYGTKTVNCLFHFTAQNGKCEKQTNVSNFYFHILFSSSRAKHAHSTLPTPTLITITCTQVLWCLERLTRPTVSCDETTRTRLTICLPAQPSVCEAF
jgi:hypothetical protein